MKAKIVDVQTVEYILDYTLYTWKCPLCGKEHKTKINPVGRELRCSSKYEFGGCDFLGTCSQRKGKK